MTSSDPLGRYPKIPFYGKDTPNSACVAFEKYDGSNLAWHWNKQEGFTKATTRQGRILDITGPDFGQAFEVFDRFKADLDIALKEREQFKGAANAVIFTEYFGPSSFAGLHVSNEPKSLIIIDVLVDQGFLIPDDFVSGLKGFPTPKIVYRGKLTGKFADAVKRGQYKVNEGVVCKGVKSGEIWSCKIKTEKWLKTLEKSFKEGWTDAAGMYRSLSEENEPS